MKQKYIYDGRYVSINRPIVINKVIGDIPTEKLLLLALSLKLFFGFERLALFCFALGVVPIVLVVSLTALTIFAELVILIFKGKK